MSYVDTSIIVAALDPQDNRTRTVSKLLSREEERLVSETTLMELASIVARRKSFVESLAKKANITSEEAVWSILHWILEKYRLIFVPTTGQTLEPLLGEMSLPILKAVKIAPEARLRSLDLLHLAHVEIMIEKGINIKRFVTADSDFQRARDYVEKKLGLELIVV